MRVNALFVQAVNLLLIERNHDRDFTYWLVKDLLR